MYYKIINDRTVFSDCKTICLDNNYPELNLVAGQWVSNPSAELIASEDWRVYVPPVIPPQPQTEPDETDIVEAVKKMLASSVEDLTDEEALEVAALYPTWASKIGQAVTAGERLWYDTKLYKVIQAHTVQQEWTPDVTPALFVEVSIEEWPEIPEVITAENAFMTGDRGTWKGQHYICQMDNCVWNPDQYPAAWQLVE